MRAYSGRRDGMTIASTAPIERRDDQRGEHRERRVRRVGDGGAVAAREHQRFTRSTKKTSSATAPAAMPSA